MANKKDLFKRLTLFSQTKLLLSIIALFSRDNSGIDLSVFSPNEPKNAGVITTNKDISKSKEFLLINESVTGLYSNIIDLLTV